MRLALLGVSHETNTFSRVPATYDRFDIYRGDEIAAQFGESHSTNAGFLEAAGDELMPTSPYVRGFRAGRTDEGGDGVTVVLV